MKKIILLLVLSMFIVSACAQQEAVKSDESLVGQGSNVPVQDAEKPVNQVQQETQAAPEEARSGDPVPAAPIQEVKEFKITAKQFQFEPPTIEVSKGDKVKLVVTSMDVPHGFAISEYGINERLDVGKPVTIEFTADKAGTFTSYCSVACGSGHGKMKGQLIVK